MNGAHKPESDPLVIAHRGASYAAPENTFAAFDLAIREGADGIEFDVRLSRDRVPVVIHDSTLRRTARLASRVSSLTAAELSEIDVGSWFNAIRPRAARDAYADERVHALREVLERFGQKSRALYVEMKFDAGEDFAPLARAVAAEVRAESLFKRVVVESFSHEALLEVKRVAPSIRTSALFERRAARPFPSSRRIVEEAIECEADEIALQLSLARRTLIEAAHEARLPVVVWTADASYWAKRARELRIHALITNRPGKMRASLDALAQASTR